MAFATPERRHTSVSILSATLAALIFALDLSQSPGIAVPVLYVAPVLLSLWQKRDLDTFVAATGCTLLTFTGLWFWRYSLAFNDDIVNRALTILVLWVAALMVIRFRRTDRDVARLNNAARASDARIRAILETAVDAILVIDTRGTVQLANPAVERVFGYPTDELLGRNVSMLMPGPDREQHDHYLARYLATGERHIIGTGREVTGRRKDGTLVPLSLAVSETHLEGLHAFTGILRDLTAQKHAEAELRERSELVRLGRMASTVAHEVRNPLAGMRGVLEVLQSRAPLNSRDADILADLIARIDALNHFVEELLVFSRPRPIEPMPTPLVPFLRHAADLVIHDPQFDGIAIEITGPDAVLDLDAEAMERAVLNLLQNAAQAIGGTGRIHIGLSAEGDRWRIVLADNGPGIPPDVREHLFDPFFTTRHGGTGLGLVIAKRVIEQHHGSIMIDSVPGTGTTAIIELPLHAGMAAGSSLGPGGSAELGAACPVSPPNVS